MKRPVIGISSGDPSGIGPEIVVKALDNKKIYSFCKPFVVADISIIKEAIKISSASQKINLIDDPSKGKYEHGYIDVLALANVDKDKFSFGEISAMAGKASFEYVTKVIELAMDGKVDATVTAPINKEAMNMAGLHYAGHTEIFAEYTGVSNYAMMLAEKNFRVVHVNTHVSMLDAIKRITKERVFNTITLADEALRRMGIENPRIAVNGLNAHAGENGLFGSEEINHIIPAVEKARKKGILADGPHPPDTIFPKMRGGQYDIVVCMYHDQGHIPAKLMGFQYDEKLKRWGSISGVNITLGLPIIRVSVDHGTAFDIAGKGIANSDSMIQTLEYAASFASNKLKSGD